MLPTETNFDLAEVIKAARGEKKVDLLFANGKVVNVFSGEIYSTNVAVDSGLIVGFGDYQAKQTIDLKGKYLTPGFIDGHMHLESSMITPFEFAQAVVPKGTTTIIADPHEIANVKGIDGIKYILRSNKVIPLDIYAMVPSCVPATPLETSGAKLTAEDILPSLTKERILGLGELMNFPGVLEKDPHVLKKIKFSENRRKIIDGHAPGVKGKDLCAYIAAGALSDHECTTREEALEKLRLGMFIMIREGSVTRDLEALLPLATPFNMHRCCFVTDDREPIDLVNEGHLNYIIKAAISKGLDPVVAITLATINPAEYFGFKHIGAIAPGYLADLVVIDDFKDFEVKMVFKKGKLVAKDGKPLFKDIVLKDRLVTNTVNVKKVRLADLEIKAKSDKANIMELIPRQVVTKRLYKKIKTDSGKVVSDTQGDILKLAVIERHHATGNIGKALVKGFGLKEGALASTVAHDSHNLIVVGTNDEDMLLAIETICKMQGGLVVANQGKVLGKLPLPIAGLMSDKKLTEVKTHLENLHKIAADLGDKTSHPFMTLSFLALPVIPELKVTDKGLVDVTRFKIIDLFDKP